MFNATCSTCLFWEKATDEDEQRLAIPIELRGNVGQCRRFPPSPLKRPNDWCGEHPDIKAMLEQLAVLKAKDKEAAAAKAKTDKRGK